MLSIKITLEHFQIMACGLIVNQKKEGRPEMALLFCKLEDNPFWEETCLVNTLDTETAAPYSKPPAF